MKFPTTVERPLRLPRKGGFNDDVKLEAYQPAALSFADKQRKGIRAVFGGCSSFTDHVRREMKQPFPIASEIPIPVDTARAAKLVAQSDPHVLAEFWDSQLDAMSALVQEAEPHQARWNDHINPVIKPVDGKVKTAALRRQARFCGFGAPKWMGQFSFGFPIAGDLSQKNTFPREENNTPILRRCRLFTSDEARFRERSPKSGWKNASDLWKEAMAQREKGWMSSPFLLGGIRPAEGPSLERLQYRLSVWGRAGG